MPLLPVVETSAKTDLQPQAPIAEIKSESKVVEEVKSVKQDEPQNLSERKELSEKPSNVQESVASVVSCKSASASGRESTYVLKAGEQKKSETVPAGPLPSKTMEIKPEALRFTDKGGDAKLKVDNNTGRRVAIKIKCSDNNLYHLKPVYFVVEKDGTAEVDVKRLDGAAKPDKLAIVYTEMPNDATDAQAVFQSNPAADKLVTANVPVFVS